MTTKPLRKPKPLPAAGFAVRVNGALATMTDGRPAAELTEEEGWAKFREECRTATRRVELLKGAIGVARIDPADEPSK